MRSGLDCSNPQPIRLARDAPGQHDRPPRVRVAASTPHPPHLLRYPLMAMGFALTRKLTRIPQPYMRFVFLGSELCLGLPSDPTSRWTPLPPASSFRHQDLQGQCHKLRLKAAEFLDFSAYSAILGTARKPIFFFIERRKNVKKFFEKR